MSTEHTLTEGEASSLERLRQVTARIRARAAELGRPPREQRSAAPDRHPQPPAAPSHWSDGPGEDADDQG
jgi:hypothetical protein